MSTMRLSEVQIENQDFLVFKELIENKYGIHLNAGKKDLLQTRLKPRIVELNMASFREYYEWLHALPAAHDEWQAFINSLTTNKTDFFREPKHFDFLEQKFLPSWLRGKNPLLKVWCAASSTGEEPFTISMCLGRHILAPKRYQILATDIDTEVLEKARAGVYRKDLIQGIPDHYKQSAFKHGTGEIQNWVKVKDHLKAPIDFQQHNLVTPESPGAGFDLIFCRNVFIYFSKETISKIIHKLHAAAKPGAYLFIGHSESLQNINTPWVYVSPSIYQKRTE